MPKNQAKNNILAQMLQEMQKRHVADYVSPKQLAALITVVQNAINELKTTTGTNLTTGLRALKGMLDSQKKVLDKVVADDTAGTEEMRKAVKTINTTLATLANNIKALQSKPEPEEYDDTDILERLDEIQEKLDTVAYDDSAILRQHEKYDKVHEDLQKQIDELRKIKTAPVAVAGGGGMHRSNITDIDITSLFDGVTKTFDIGAVYNIINVSLSSYPYGTLRKNVDYTFTNTTITFTDTIAADTQLSEGQSCVITAVTI